MWVSSKLLDLFSIGKETVDGLRQELSLAKSELESLKDKCRTLQINGDWFRMKVNSLEMERTALMEKAYQIKLPTPQIMKQPTVDPTYDPKNFGFGDVGDEIAKTLGLPSYDN